MATIDELATLLSAGLVPQQGFTAPPTPRPKPIRVQPRTSGFAQPSPQSADPNAGAPPANPAPPSPSGSMPQSQGSGSGLLSGVTVPTFGGDSSIGDIIRSAAGGIASANPSAPPISAFATGLAGSASIGAQNRQSREEQERIRQIIEGAAGLSPEQKAAAMASPEIGRQVLADIATRQPEKPNWVKAERIDPETGLIQRGYEDPNTGQWRPMGAPMPPSDDWTSAGEGRVFNKRTGEFRVAPGTGKPEAKLSDLSSIRKEFESQPGVSRYRTAAPILSSMVKSVDDPSAMADLDFVYGMAKVFDPDSVVRESEMGMVIEGQSLPASLVGMFNRVANGEQVLGPEARRNLVAASANRVGEYRAQAEREANEFTSIATRNGIDPADVVRGLDPMPDVAASEAQAAPPSSSRELPTVTNDAEFDALPSGTRFVDPEGNIRTKP